VKLIKFTFDVDKVFDQLKNNFSNLTGKVCAINYNRMITQKEIFDKLPKIPSKGFCVLASIYNAFPDVFENIDELVDFIKCQINNNKNYASLKKITEEINNYKHKKLLFSEQNLNDSYMIACNSLDKNKPVVISYIYLKSMLIPDPGQHAVTLVGYDNDYLYYIENSEDNYLYVSLAFYIYGYYKSHPITENNPEYENIKKCIENDFNANSWKNILGYSNGQYNIKSLKKSFLTNGAYFYDLNRLITYNGNITPPENIDSFSDRHTNFSDLINKLKNIEE